MRDNVAAVRLLDTLYIMIADNITDEICQTCPVVRDAVKDATYEQTVNELGTSFPKMKCPCQKS